ncbi:hypothetical protein HAALTHF_54390n [Vreelandella aquamarina]|nr:hypothetical protein HAALTHF_54390n [Halomonas axialensis]
MSWSTTKPTAPRTRSWRRRCAKKAREEGLILLSCGMYGNTIRFLMPVTIEDDVLNEGLDIIESCLESLI